MRVLISGFEPFGGRPLNPTSLLMEALSRGEISYPSTLNVKAITLPVTFHEAFETIKAKIDEFNPDVIISFGQAAKRDAINIETIAINIIDADIADNAGAQPKGIPINDSGESAYPSTLPVQGIEGALQKAGIAVKSSNTAGTYVCNYLFYRLMEYNQGTERLCGFIHVPLIPEQAEADEVSMPFEEMKRALSVILNYIDY